MAYEQGLRACRVQVRSGARSAATERPCADIGTARYPPAKQCQAGEDGSGTQGDRAKEIEHDDLQIHPQSMMPFLASEVVTICLEPSATRDAEPLSPFFRCPKPLRIPMGY